MSWQFIVDQWNRGDVNAMSELLYRRIKDGKEEDVHAILNTLLHQMRGDKRWIQEQRDLMRDEAERIALLGQTMKRAGLRSYTDEKGRIFIAAGE